MRIIRIRSLWKMWLPTVASPSSISRDSLRNIRTTVLSTICISGGSGKPSSCCCVRISPSRMWRSRPVFRVSLRSTGSSGRRRDARRVNTGTGCCRRSRRGNTSSVLQNPSSALRAPSPRKRGEGKLFWQDNRYIHIARNPPQRVPPCEYPKESSRFAGPSLGCNKHKFIVYFSGRLSDILFSTGCEI